MEGMRNKRIRNWQKMPLRFNRKNDESVFAKARQLFRLQIFASFLCRLFDFEIFLLFAYRFFSVTFSPSRCGSVISQQTKPMRMAEKGNAKENIHYVLL